jgi:hypothetical protein
MHYVRHPGLRNGSRGSGAEREREYEVEIHLPADSNAPALPTG